ncbi:probable WRKY transcription factor 53 [Cornus florida]|uniref:probable WRKY transcription factor 53 n=1 Tax=Cornus florida TaxID=4283 RepID=UPI00289F7B15|nr:probable WRKY transcription factor 53 [Cornus florida]
MESGWSCEHMTLINELTEGMELAKQLKFHLNSTSSVETRELLLQRMVSSFEKALLILKWSGSVGEPQTAAAPTTTGLPESSISVDGSPGSEDFDRGFKDQQELKDVSKKRKGMPTWSEQVRICSENGLEGPNDDGYSWRKYGQKDILGANYPRSYYRCTYRSVQNCWATKQVQRSDDDPTIFEITYRGRHTCNQNRHTAPQPPSPEKQEPRQIKHYISHHQQQHQNQPNEMLLNLQTNLRVNTKDLENNKEKASTFSFPSTFGFMNSENQNFPFPTLVHHGDNVVLENYSSSFVSPATSGSNFFSVSPCQMNSNRWVHNLQQHRSESDLTEIISATTSATNSPIVDLDFSIDPQLDLDPNFPFDTPGFFN